MTFSWFAIDTTNNGPTHVHSLIYIVPADGPITCINMHIWMYIWVISLHLFGAIKSLKCLTFASFPKYSKRSSESSQQYECQGCIRFMSKGKQLLFIVYKDFVRFKLWTQVSDSMVVSLIYIYIHCKAFSQYSLNICICNNNSSIIVFSSSGWSGQCAFLRGGNCVFNIKGSLHLW